MMRIPPLSTLGDRDQRPADAPRLVVVDVGVLAFANVKRCKNTASVSAEGAVVLAAVHGFPPAGSRVGGSL
jgi:hypothetical protein